MTASGGVLHGLVAAAARRHPEAVAVVDGSRELTYATLDAESSRLAHLLAAAGAGPGQRVGLYLDKSAEAVVGIYGILKAGAAYVPLDPQAPASRLGLVAADCGITHLVSSAARAPAWPGLMDHGAALAHVFVLDAPAGDVDAGVPGVAVHGTDGLADGPPPAPAVAVGPDDLAYVLYTSGSTGVPKGVMLTHANATAFVDWAVERFAITASDRLSSHAPLHFDLSVFDLFAAAAAGARVVLVPRTASVFPAEVARFVDRHRVTVWYSVPSVLSMLATRGGLAAPALPSLRLVLFAGEVFPTRYLRRLMELVPHAGFHNLYGPTETNVCTHYEVARLPGDDATAIPIGAAISGVEVFAVDDHGRRAGVGEEGELYVRGPTVTPGYWGDPHRSAAVLVADPRPGHSGVAYRTGDLVSLGPDGNYRFLGRRDAQVKSRGYRIELGDVEAALYAEEAVVECAVVAVPDDVVTNRLRAYVVVKGDVDVADLVRGCRRRLPAYMVPEEVRLVATLPKTSTGKVDRRALVGRGDGG